MEGWGEGKSRMKKVCWMLVWLALGNASAGSDLYISGVVIDGDNLARPDVMVGLLKTDMDEQMEIPVGDPPDWDKMIEGRGWWRKTNRDGEFVFTGLTGGKYLLNVVEEPSPGGTEYAMLDFELADGSISNVCLLPGVIPRHVLRGILRSFRTGESIQADVDVTPYDLEVTPGSVSWMLESTRKVRTGPEGEFVKTGLPAGGYMVRLSGMDEAVHGRSAIGFNIRMDDAGTVSIEGHYREYLAGMGVDLRFEGEDSPRAEQSRFEVGEEDPPRPVLEKITCPRCHGEPPGHAECVLCGGQGAVWVEQ